MALLLPVLALILSVLVQVGLTGVDQVRLWHAAREGAREAAVTGDGAKVRSAVVRGGLGDVRMKVAPPAPYRSLGDPVTVTLSYAPPWRTPLVGGWIGPSRLVAAASMRIEQP
jgi:hypothetical protein